MLGNAPKNRRNIPRGSVLHMRIMAAGELQFVNDGTVLRISLPTWVRSRHQNTNSTAGLTITEIMSQGTAAGQQEGHKPTIHAGIALSQHSDEHTNYQHGHRCSGYHTAR